MSVQEATTGNAVLEDESESGLKKEKLPLTEDEDAFKGPRFYPPVYRRRYAAVCELVKKHQAKKVLDFGCAEAKLLKVLISQETLSQLEEVVGVDINRALLEENKFRIQPLTSDYLRPRSHPFKVSLYQGSISEADERFVDFDLIACIELIEHLEPDVLNSMPEAVFGQLSPKVVIVTTPNVEFNVLFPDLKGFRHYDHKFEWTRAEFEEWANFQASKYHYTVTFDGIGPGPEGTEQLGCCSQVAVFERISSSATPTNKSGMHQLYNLIAEVQYPYREDRRTEQEKILQEVEYILWVLSSKREEEDEQDEPDDESTPSDQDGHVVEDLCNDCTIKVEDDEDCIYSLEKLLSFPSLYKLCGDIQKLKDVLQDSSLFHLTEDRFGVLWRQPSQHWSSDESDAGWDACDDDQGEKEFKRHQDATWDEPENWEDDSDTNSCVASNANTASLNTAANTEVCWDSSDDCCKLWNGKDWGELEDSGAQEEVEEEYITNLHYRDNVTIAHESDGSLSNDSDENDIDGLLWISDSGGVAVADMT